MLTLGGFPAVSLDRARQEVKPLDLVLIDGENPFKSERSMTVAVLAIEYMKRHALPKKRSADQDRRKCKADVSPALGNHLATEVSKADIVRLLDTITDRGAPIGASRTLALMRKLYNWAIAEGYVVSNPAAGIPRRAKEESRSRVLSDQEIKDFWAALDGPGFDNVTAVVLRLQLLLGARPNPNLELPDYLTRRVNELTVEDSRRACAWLKARDRERKRHPERPFIYRIAELECSLGELRQMDDAKLSKTLGVSQAHDVRFGQPLPDGVGKVRAIIGPATRFPDAAAPGVNVSTPLNSRRLLDEAFARLQAQKQIAGHACFGAAIVAANSLVRAPGCRWPVFPDTGPPSAPEPSFKPETQHYADLSRALWLARACFLRKDELRDGGRRPAAANRYPGVVAAFAL